MIIMKSREAVLAECCEQCMERLRRDQPGDAVSEQTVEPDGHRERPAFRIDF